jgi:hypothetical protein
MAKGLPGADSSSPVTTQFNEKTLIDLATDLFGTAPAFWGRYFTSVSTSGAVEYRHKQENQPLRDNNIRVLPVARQTKRVSGSESMGAADAMANADDILATFGADYLHDQGGAFLVFLDVEGTPPLSVAYYKGWAQTLKDHSAEASSGKVTLLPAVYGTRFDDETWRAVAQAHLEGVECSGVWIARWKWRGCAALPDFEADQVRPRVDIPCDVLFWQYSDECHGGDGFDCNTTNPGVDQEDLLNKLILPPPALVA